MDVYKEKVIIYDKFDNYFHFNPLINFEYGYVWGKIMNITFLLEN